jgi:tRNA splicing endonuclease
MDVDSDSDISLLGDVDHRGKGKAKGKVADKRKKDKGKAKAKEVGKPACPHAAILISLQQAYTWEASYTRSWDTVQEDEAGSLQGAVEDLMARGRRRRSIHSMPRIVVFVDLVSQVACTRCCYSAYYHPTFGSPARPVSSNDGPRHAPDSL